VGSNAKIAVTFASLLLAMIFMTTGAEADLKKDGTCGWWSSFLNCYDRGRDSEKDSLMDEFREMILSDKECPGEIPALDLGAINDETLVLVQCGSDGLRYLIRVVPGKYPLEFKVEEPR